MPVKFRDQTAKLARFLTSSTATHDVAWIIHVRDGMNHGTDRRYQTQHALSTDASWAGRMAEGVYGRQITYGLLPKYHLPRYVLGHRPLALLLGSQPGLFRAMPVYLLQRRNARMGTAVALDSCFGEQREKALAAAITGMSYSIREVGIPAEEGEMSRASLELGSRRNNGTLL